MRSIDLFLTTEITFLLLMTVKYQKKGTAGYWDTVPGNLNDSLFAFLPSSDFLMSFGCLVLVLIHPLSFVSFLLSKYTTSQMRPRHSLLKPEPVSVTLSLSSHPLHLLSSPPHPSPPSTHIQSSAVLLSNQAELAKTCRSQRH